MESKPKFTSKDCYNEIVRLLRLYFYSKADEGEKETILKSVKQTLESLAQIEHYKMLQEEKRRADREARKLGIKR